MRDVTPDRLVVTGRRNDFYQELRPGDVLLFQGADFLAGLAQLTERRTCYHSAIYLGPDGPLEEGGTPVLAHNVSTLWWRDLAADVAEREGEGSLHPPLGAILEDGPERTAFLEVLARRLVEHGLANPWGENPDQLADRAFQLVARGGVGAVSVDDYLDKCHSERLYGGTTRGEPVHHVRSVVALRHQDLVQPDLDPARREISETALLLAAEATAEDAIGFNAAELLSVVPECIDRPGYREWAQLSDLADHPDNRRLLARLFGLSRRGRKAPPARELLRRRLRTIDPFGFFFPDPGGPGWICASYVIQTFAKADFGLDADCIEDVDLEGPAGTTVPLSTPRDLWDCPTLVPVAMFVRGPERWRPSGPPAAAATAATPRPGDAPVDGAMYVDLGDGRTDASLEVAPGLEVPVVAGPSTADDARAFARDAAAWRWATVTVGDASGDEATRRRGRRGRRRRATRRADEHWTPGGDPPPDTRPPA